MNISFCSGASPCDILSKIFRIGILSRLAIFLFLLLFSASSTAESCPGEMSYCFGPDCFCSFQAAEDFLKNRPPTGKYECLVQESVSERQRLPVFQYSCEPRAPMGPFDGTERFSLDRATAGIYEGRCDDTFDPFGNEEPYFTCSDEEIVIDAFFNRIEAAFGCPIGPARVAPDFLSRRF